MQHPQPSKTIAVFGLGYVGCVSTACLADAGHRVIGVDVQEAKVSLINRGIATIVEPGLDEKIAAASQRGAIRATTDVNLAVREANIILVTVGTPSRPDGELNLSHIFDVAEQIGQCLRGMNDYRAIAIRSTIKPGTCQQLTDVIERSSGKKSGVHFSVVANPEFLREGSAIKDYLHPPYVLIGSSDTRGADEVTSIYGNIDAPVMKVSLSTAETIKYVNNSWHAIKVAFANEVGSVCRALSIDAEEVMDVFVRDRLLNISPSYLRPGFAFGGACLPKDLSALVALAQETGVDAPLLASIHQSNDRHIDRAIELIKREGNRRVGVLGLSFKAGTDDVRNSPALRVVLALIDEGYDVKVFDETVRLAISSGRSVPSYRAALGRSVDLLVDSAAALEQHAEIVVIAKKDPAFVPLFDLFQGKKVIDLVGMGRDLGRSANYVGLAW